MDPRIKQRFNDGLLAEAMRRFDIDPGQIEALDGFESFIYAFTRGGSRYILRIGHDSRRTEALIRGEVEWINYLARNGAGAAPAVESARGNLVEALPDGHGQNFVAVSFAYAPGGPSGEKPWDAAFFERYGRLMGRVHALSRDYQPVYPRMHWDGPEMKMDSPEVHLPPGEALALSRYRELIAHLNTLPRDDRAAYGMIHQDAHGGNFFVADDGTITLFDFDDCVFAWYAYDIAMVLFYAAVGKPDMVEYTRQFMPPFLRGYAQENTLDPRWLAEIPHFLKLREIDLYAVIHRSFDVTNITDRWVKMYMTGRKERIEQGIPLIDFDFASLAGELTRP